MSLDLAKKLTQWRRDPVLFVREAFRIEPDLWQLEILREFPNQNRICLKAAKGCGKTTVLSWLCWNFLVTRPYPRIAATSITADNLSDTFWPEMAKWQKKCPLLREKFIWTKTRIVSRETPETHFMSARTWPKSADPQQQADTLAGFHADYLMFILDESGGIPDAVVAAAEAGLATGIETKLIQAGNPTHLEGPLYRACTREKHLWYLVEVTGDPDDPKRSSRISLQWAKEQIDKYGRDNPWVQVNVFGNFPQSNINTLLGPDDVSRAIKRTLHESDYSFAQKRLGIDVARFGSDATVIFPRQGLRAFVPVTMRAARTDAIAARVALAKAKWNGEMEFIDDTGGYGAGVIDCLIQAGHSPVGVNFSGQAIEPRYFNKRSEIWFNMAEWVKRGGCLPDVPELASDLTIPTYTFHNGKFRLEEKEQIRQRLGRSPDYGDALALTFAMAEMPAMNGLPFGFEKAGQYVSDYNPFSDDRL